MGTPRKTMIERLYQGLMDTILCRHRRVTWPQRGRQICLDCGREREFSGSLTTRFICGDWHASEETADRRQRLIGYTLIATLTAAFWYCVGLLIVRLVG